MGTGTRLKIALNEYGLTVAELSRKTGISTNTFYSMIKRDNDKISPNMLKKICDNTPITIYDLLDDYDVFADYDTLAEKYSNPSATKKEMAMGNYILTTIKNDNMLSEIIDTYNSLNNLGKNTAHERVTELLEIPKYIEETATILNAAHERTDIETTEEMKKHDDDIMNDENF